MKRNNTAPLPASFYARDTIRVARGLLGCVLRTVRRGAVTSGRIVEVEAYLGPDDPAAHGYGNRRSARNAAMFGPPGTAYVYFIYGMHWCVNTVTEREGHPSAVLIRALEPLQGVATMRRRRGGVPDARLCAGPGMLCQALGITGSLSGRPLDGTPIGVWPAHKTTREIMVTSRVGISRATDWPLRFLLSA